ncbi:MAG TPA: plastocyanin/azurin family copper-binding protein [Frankiaceae bacterium]|nr:plastocyanin/azurin family copper-binding protein [Frankiaceae bacterium]
MLADRPLRLAAVLAAAALALTACAETERTKPSSHATAVPVPTVKLTVNPAPTTPAAPTESGTAAPTGGATASATGGAKPGGNEVLATITNKFEPGTLNVKKGTKVTWTAEGTHSVTSGSDGKEDPKGPMKGPINFTTYSVTFKEAGTFPYYCIPHVSLGMVGEVVVS